MPLEVIDSRTAALLVVDAQNAFLREKGTRGISGGDAKQLASAVSPLKRLIERFQAAGIPVILTTQEHFPVDAGRAQRRLAGDAAARETPCLAGSWDAAIVDDLKPLAAADPSCVVRTHRSAAFYGTRLDALLRQLGTRTLFVTGTTTNGCVETSIREACLRDYDVVAVTDCLFGPDAALQQAVQRLSDQDLCVLHQSGELIAWLEAQAVPRILDFAHMLLQVGDIEVSRRFYTDLLGFTPRKAAPLADGRPFVPFRQGLALTSGGPDNLRQIDHMAFRVNDVRAIAQRLAAANVRFFNELHDGIYGLTIYVADPDGNKVELFQEGAKLA